MIQRVRKQITYGVGFGIVMATLITLVVRSVVSDESSGANVPTPTPQFAAIILETTDIIRHNVGEGEDKTVDIVARLRNPNPSAGIMQYRVNFILADAAGREIIQHSEETYLLPGTVQYVIALNVRIGRQTVSQVETRLPENPVFVGLPANASRPTFSSFARERIERSVGTRLLQEQRGIVKNTSTFDWQTVDVSAIGLSATGQVIATGKTTIGALRVGEEREFNILWPKPLDQVARVIVLPATNMYKDENIIRTVGNPALLQ